MIVDDLKRAWEGERLVVSGRLTWENSNRKATRLRFEFEPTVADDVECNPNAFLAATAAPAMYYGEKRLLIEGKICPVLVDNLLTVLTQFREWYDKKRTFPAIESTDGVQTRVPRSPRRAAQFFSGGIDALTTLRRNRLHYPADHPLSIRDCINVFGMHLDDYTVETEEPNPARVAMWDYNLKQIRRIAEAADVEFYQIRTNVLGVFDKPSFFIGEYLSSVMLSLSHLLTRRISDVFLASSDYLGDFAPCASHPLIDPYYGSSDIQVYHDGSRLTRLEKVRLISDWPAARSMINVCSSWEVPEDGMNCGHCAKCVRTMTELLVCGKLHESPTFHDNDVDPAVFKKFALRSAHEVAYLVECIEPLRAMGREDLIKAIEERFHDYEMWLRRRSGRGLKQKLKQIDEHLFGGLVRERWQAFRGIDPLQSDRLAQRAALSEAKRNS
ncbi:MAG: hypothetical protein AB7O26_10555 [Planctomycetaceae bacterium]